MQIDLAFPCRVKCISFLPFTISKKKIFLSFYFIFVSKGGQGGRGAGWREGGRKERLGQALGGPLSGFLGQTQYVGTYYKHIDCIYDPKFNQCRALLILHEISVLSPLSPQPRSSYLHKMTYIQNLSFVLCSWFLWLFCTLHNNRPTAFL